MEKDIVPAEFSVQTVPISGPVSASILQVVSTDTPLPHQFSGLTTRHESNFGKQNQGVPCRQEGRTSTTIASICKTILEVVEHDLITHKHNFLTSNSAIGGDVSNSMQTSAPQHQRNGLSVGPLAC